MRVDHGPIVVLAMSFVLGAAASLTRPVHGAAARALALAGADRDATPWRRATLISALLVGMAACITPFGFVAGLSGNVTRYGLYQVWLGLVAVCVLLAASMFGAFDLSLPRTLRERLSTVGGGGGVRGALALGLVMPLLSASTIIPLAVGLGTVVATWSSVWLGTGAFFAFTLGASPLSFAAVAYGVHAPGGAARSAGAKWVCGVALGHLAFVHLHHRYDSVEQLVRNPHYDFGMLTGGVLLVGGMLGAAHVWAESRAARSGAARPSRLSCMLKLASIVPALVGGSLFAAWAPHPHGNAPPVVWFADEEQGRTVARDDGKPFVVVFNAEWCCKEVEYEIFPDPRVREEATRFVAIAIDATNDEDRSLPPLQQKYKVIGLPTMILFDRDGTEVTRFNSYITPDVMAAAMKRVR